MKGPRNSNQIVTIFFIRPRGGHIGFQNGRHFQHILAYISTSDPKNEVKMMAIPMFLISWIAIKVLRKLLLIFCFGGHLGFQNGRHFQHILAYISTFELPREVKMVAIPMLMMLRDIIKALGK